MPGTLKLVIEEVIAVFGVLASLVFGISKIRGLIKKTNDCYTEEQVRELVNKEIDTIKQLDALRSENVRQQINDLRTQVLAAEQLVHRITEAMLSKGQ